MTFLKGILSSSFVVAPRRCELHDFFSSSVRISLISVHKKKIFVGPNVLVWGEGMGHSEVNFAIKDSRHPVGPLMTKVFQRCYKPGPKLERSLSVVLPLQALQAVRDCSYAKTTKCAAKLLEVRWPKPKHRCPGWHRWFLS